MREFCEALFPGVVAEMLEDMGSQQAWEVLQHASANQQAEIFSFFDFQFQIELVDLIGTKPLSRIIENMSPDDRVDLLERMDPDHVEDVLRLVAQAERSDIRKLLSYPDDSAGSIMTTEYASLPVDITVKEALDRLPRSGPQSRNNLLCLRHGRRTPPARFSLVAKTDSRKTINTTRRDHGTGCYLSPC